MDGENVLRAFKRIIHSCFLYAGDHIVRGITKLKAKILHWFGWCRNRRCCDVNRGDGVKDRKGIYEILQ